MIIYHRSHLREQSKQLLNLGNRLPLELDSTRVEFDSTGVGLYGSVVWCFSLQLGWALGDRSLEERSDRKVWWTIFFVFFLFLMSNDLFRWDVDVKVRCWWGNSLLFFWLRWLKFYNMFPVVFYKFWFWNPMECVLRWDAREATELAHIYACVLWMGGWWAGHISSGGGLGVISYDDGKMM